MTDSVKAACEVTEYVE